MLVYDCHAKDVNRGDAGLIDYSFNMADGGVTRADGFSINPITCVIRSEIVLDREAVDSYVVSAYLPIERHGDLCDILSVVVIANGVSFCVSYVCSFQS